MTIIEIRYAPGGDENIFAHALTLLTAYLLRLDMPREGTKTSKAYPSILIGIILRLDMPR